MGVTAEGGRTAYGPLVTRFVALGDSLTEGVGDPHDPWPNGLRGWADLVAARLAEADPSTEYANLALRARTARDVLVEQVPAALELRPDVVSIWAGGNDILRPRLRLENVLAPIDRAVAELSASGALVVVLTGFEVTGSPVLGAVRSRVHRLNAGLRDLTDRGDILIADVSGRQEWSDRRLWAEDRVHPSAQGHRRIAAQVGRLLGLDAAPDVPLAPRPEPRSRRQAVREEVEWWRGHAGPHIGRWATRASRRDTVRPKWAVPVRPAEWPPWADQPMGTGRTATI